MKRHTELDNIIKMRALGHSWAKVGNALGMSRQGAQQIYSRAVKGGLVK